MSEFSVTVEQVNALGRDAFVQAFGDVAEHSPWVAERAAARRPFADREAMAGAFIDAIFDASDAEKLALVRAHPDLAGRAAVSGEIANESKREQAGAGLDRLTPQEFARFSELNETYRARFQFPFILAVKGATKHQILDAFQKRINSDPEAELAMAIRQIARIVTFRIEDRVRA
jgi:2-oxo-4-hydroxy-4-carboxy-5-ureidoimidazoline decarboxylase